MAGLSATGSVDDSHPAVAQVLEEWLKVAAGGVGPECADDACTHGRWRGRRGMDITQRPDGDFQSGSDLFHVVETQVAFGALHGADVGAMEPAQFREHLLGPSALLAVAAHAASEALAGRAGHGEQPCVRGDGQWLPARFPRVFLRIPAVCAAQCTAHRIHGRLGEAVGAEEDPPSGSERVEVVRSG